MFTRHSHRIPFSAAAALLACVSLFGYGCSDDDSTNSGSVTSKFTASNLVSDISGFGAVVVDPNLANACGIATGPTGIFWISANHSGSFAIYDSTGAILLAPIPIPSPTDPTGGAPTGMVYNSTSDFVIPGGAAAKFIVATEDGTIAAWASGSSAVKVVDRSATNAVYKGLAMAADGLDNFLYATDFRNRRIDVFDKNFTLVTTKPFIDSAIPSDYGPFNIQNIGGSLFVSYAKHKAPDNMDDQSGPGNGYVDVFYPSGTLNQRLISQGALNSPWGLAMAPTGFGDFGNSLLVGNFGDGTIHAYSMTGASMGALKDSAGHDIKIEGLWALFFPPQFSNNKLYFSAGPNDETDGLFGFIGEK